MKDTAFGMVMSFSASPQLAFGVVWAAKSLVSGSQTVKQLSSARAVGCCGLQHGGGMQHDHCLIPEVPHTYGGGQKRLQSLCAPEGHPKSKIQHTGCQMPLGLDTALLLPGQLELRTSHLHCPYRVRKQILDLSVSYCSSEALFSPCK